MIAVISAGRGASAWNSKSKPVLIEIEVECSMMLSLPFLFRDGDEGRIRLLASLLSSV